MPIKNELLKNLIDIKYEELINYKKVYHAKGTLNKCNSWYMVGIIDTLTSEIDSLQGLLGSYKELDKTNGGN